VRFALIGDPVAHSKSPAMHAAAYRALGMEHTYEAIRCDASDLAAIVARVRSGDLDGVNVTVPHKQRILDHVDSVDASAIACGAANTLARQRDGTVRAYNTDAPALAKEIRALAGRTLHGATAIVLGSGGAARAAIAACAIDLGVASVVVRARAFADPASRVELAREWPRLLSRAGSAAKVSAAPLGIDLPIDRAASIVVQATSAGMSGAAPGDGVAAAVAWDALASDAVAIDAVYAPPETPFLRAARARGLRAANGLGMLARQGALAFELWLGVAAPYDAMLAAIGA
jgi:shikimate dehydrogenase